MKPAAAAQPRGHGWGWGAVTPRSFGHRSVNSEKPIIISMCLKHQLTRPLARGLTEPRPMTEWSLLPPRIPRGLSRDLWG